MQTRVTVEKSLSLFIPESSFPPYFCIWTYHASYFQFPYQSRSCIFPFCCHLFFNSIFVTGNILNIFITYTFTINLTFSFKCYQSYYFSAAFYYYSISPFIIATECCFSVNLSFSLLFTSISKSLFSLTSTTPLPLLVILVVILFRTLEELAGWSSRKITTADDHIHNWYQQWRPWHMITLPHELTCCYILW